MNYKVPPRSTNSCAQNWHTLYQAALFESDRSKVPERIAAAEQAILRRMKDLFNVADDHIEEDLVLDDALYAIRALRNCITQENHHAPHDAAVA